MGSRVLTRSRIKPDPPASDPSLVDRRYERLWRGLRDFVAIGDSGLGQYAMAISGLTASPTNLTYKEGRFGRALQWPAAQNPGDNLGGFGTASDWKYLHGAKTGAMSIMAMGELTTDGDLGVITSNNRGASAGDVGFMFRRWFNNDEGNLRIMNGSGTNLIDMTTPAGGIVARPAVYVVTFDANLTADHAKWYLDGDLIATASKSGDPSTADSTTGTLHIGADGDGDNTLADSSLAFMAFWDRALGTREVLDLTRDPFGPFRMARQTMVVVPTAAISNDRMADMAFCRGTLPFGVGRLPIPDGTID